MSRFFKGGRSDSESSDSDSSSSSVEFSDNESIISESSQEVLSDNEQMALKNTGAAKFMRGAADSDDEDSDEDVKRVVRSTRDKRFDDMRVIVKALNNAKKINDWVNIQNEFDKLSKAIIKAAAIISREKNPRFFIRTLFQLDNHVNKTLENKDLVKKMNPSTAKALNAMKQKVRKLVKTYEADIEQFKLKPVEEDESASEAERLAAEESDESEDEAPQKIIPSKETTTAVMDEDNFTVIGRGGKAVEISKDNLLKKLSELLENRGKKSTDKFSLMESIGKLLSVAGSPYQSLKVLLALISARFDCTSTSSGYTPVDIWKSTLTELNRLFDILEKYPNVSIGATDDDLDENEVINEKTFISGSSIRIPGHLGSFIDRLDDEFAKSLQNIDPHSSEYIERLRDESLLYAIIVRAQIYFEKKEHMKDSVDNISMRRVEHIYSKSDELIKMIEESVKNQYPALIKQNVDPMNLVAKLCTDLYKTPIDRVRTRALLCHVYHLALHDKFSESRDMLLMSHLQENISLTDIQTQVLYNRTMVQIGLAAFRCGMIRDACYSLQDISSSGKIRELLAQGYQMQRFSEKTAEQEKLEKQRQMPFHSHINLEVIECVYLVSAMLLEIPKLANPSPENKKKVISKSFRRMLDYSEKSSFNGPPENSKDFIMGASKAMASGEWEKCRDLILSIKIWDIMPNSDEIKKMLTNKIQEESLKTYIFTYSKFYDTLSIVDLSEMFNLTQDTVTRILSRMILHEDISAHLDYSNNIAIMDNCYEKNLSAETMANNYVEKMNSFVDSNEKLLESKTLFSGIQSGMVGATSGYRTMPKRTFRDKQNKN